MKKFILLSLLLNLNHYNQTIVSGNLENYTDIYLSNIPGTNSTDEYQPPADSILDLWGVVIEDIMNENYLSADLAALQFGYHLVEFYDTSSVYEGTFYILEKTQASTNFWGMFIFDSNAIRKSLVIEAPHPLKDLNTGKQGLSIFKIARAKVLFISGANRCNSSTLSDCSGTTTVCSSTSQKYRISDQPHIVDGTFQKTTEVLESLIENVIIIQPHGFSKGSGDPDLIMSNGTRLTPTKDYLTELRDNLLAIDNSLTFKIAHIDLTWTRLIATTNTQGRLINGSNEPCTLNSTSTTGRFLHIEQAYPKLRDSKINRIKLANAITMTFPEDTVVSTDINSVSNIQFNLKQNYPNPFNPSTTIEYSIQKSGNVTLSVYDMLGRIIKVLVKEFKNTGIYSTKFESDNISGGIYFYVLKINGSITSKKMILIK